MGNELCVSSKSTAIIDSDESLCNNSKQSSDSNPNSYSNEQTYATYTKHESNHASYSSSTSSGGSQYQSGQLSSTQTIPDQQNLNNSSHQIYPIAYDHSTTLCLPNELHSTNTIHSINNNNSLPNKIQGRFDFSSIVFSPGSSSSGNNNHTEQQQQQQTEGTILTCNACQGQDYDECSFKCKRTIIDQLICNRCLSNNHQYPQSEAEYHFWQSLTELDKIQCTSCGYDHLPTPEVNDVPVNKPVDICVACYINQTVYSYNETIVQQKETINELSKHSVKSQATILHLHGRIKGLLEKTARLENALTRKDHQTRNLLEKVFRLEAIKKATKIDVITRGIGNMSVTGGGGGAGAGGMIHK
jgi:hypothetical protein